MSNPENDTPETETQTGDETEGFALPLSALTQAGSAMRSAEGVGPLLREAINFVDQKSFAQPGLIPDPETGSMVSVILKPDGTVEKLPADWFDEHNGQPRFRRGKAVMTSLDSFIGHVNRFGDEDSAVFANDDRASPSLLAVLDYHCRDTLRLEGEADQVGERIHGDYRFGKHRTFFAFPLSDEWKAWNAANKKVMSMIEFASFLEERVGDIDLFDGAIPESLQRFVTVNGGAQNVADYASLIELSRGLKVHESSVISEAQTLATGEGHIRFTTEHTSTQVKGQTVKVPTMFFIALPVFLHGAFYRIGAALRYRKTGDGLKFWYELHRADKVFDHAFGEALDRVRAETEATVFLGQPEA